MTESLIQAYSNSPRRKKIQIIGGIFLVVTTVAVMLILYLVVTARVVSMGRQLQQAKDEIDHLVYLSVNYQNEIARLTRFEVMELKAQELGFRAPYPGEVFYVPIKGFDQQEKALVVIQNNTRPAVINVNLLEYHETLFEWIGNRISDFLAPFEGL